MEEDGQYWGQGVALLKMGAFGRSHWWTDIWPKTKGESWKLEGQGWDQEHLWEANAVKKWVAWISVVTREVMRSG